MKNEKVVNLLNLLTIIRVLIFERKFKIFNKQIKNNININDFVFEQVGKGHIFIMKILLYCGLDINIQQSDTKNTLLIWASRESQVNMVKFLLRQNNIDVNKENIYGYTALSWAMPNKEIVKLLLNVSNINVNMENDYAHEKLILWASREGYIDIVKLLVNTNVDINDFNDSDETALDLAMKNNHTEIITILKENGGIENKNGEVIENLLNGLNLSESAIELLNNICMDDVTPDLLEKLQQM